MWAAAALLMAAALLVAPDRSVEGGAAQHGGGSAAGGDAQAGSSVSIHGPAALSVQENTAIGELIATYSVRGSTGGSAFSFSLEGGDSAKYEIDAYSGELFTSGWLDFESDETDAFTVVASDGALRATLDVAVNVEDVEDSVSTLRVRKANPVPGIGRGNPAHALDELLPENFVETDWARWETILRIEVQSETPDPNCGTGLDCVFLRLESIDAEAVEEIEARRSGERGTTFLAGVKLVRTVGDLDVTFHIVGTDGVEREVELLVVDEEDSVVIGFGNLRGSVDVENDPPEFDDLEFEQNLEFERVDVEFTFDVTDADSGLPEPEDLPDVDYDEDYMPVTALVHDSQCYGDDQSGESLEAAEGIDLHTGLIFCAGDPEIHPIRDDRDFDEIMGGYEVATSLILEQDRTYFVTFVACDYAGNCTAFDADEDSDALLQRIDTPAPAPADPCVSPISGDTTVEGTWDGTCPSGRAPEPYGGEGDRYARYYTFSLEAASDVIIALTSEEDTYLYLLDAHGKDGRALYENDDITPGNDLNSRIEENLQAGDYTIEATTYHSQKTGDFTLEVSGIGRAQPEPEADCSSGTAVRDADDNAGLVSDCEVLLAARDALGGNASLNWSADVHIGDWDGIIHWRIAGARNFAESRFPKSWWDDSGRIGQSRVSGDSGPDREPSRRKYPR